MAIYIEYLGDQPNSGSVTQTTQKEEQLGNEPGLAQAAQEESSSIGPEDGAEDDGQFDRSAHLLPVVSDHQ